MAMLPLLGRRVKTTVHFILLSITATLGNSLILVALHKESSLHPPSKLLYRCLAATDLFVGLATQPLYATYWMSVVHEHWSLCRYSFDASSITGYALCSVSLSTLTVISMDRLLALLLGLRYKEIVTLRCTFIILAIVWVVCLVTSLFRLLSYRVALWCSPIGILCCLVISIASYTKIFRALSHHQVQVQDHAQQQPSLPNALNIARYIQKGSALCTVGAFSFSFLLCTIFYSGNCGHF